MAVVDISNTYQLTNVGAHIDNTDVYNSNFNFVDNPFFTIRQRGTGGVTGVGYAVDRWKNTGGANLTQTPRSPYGVTFSSSSGYQVDQALWSYPAECFDGETLTISVMTSGGSIAQATGVFTATSSTAAKVAVTSADGNFVVGLYYIPSARAVPFVRITTPSGKFPVNAAILAVKLELGSYSTLANDVPPDCGEELRKCQRYFVRLKDNGNYNYIPIGNGVWNTGTSSRILIRTPVQMRETPSISRTGTFYVAGNGVQYTVSSIGNSGLSITPEGVFVNVVLSATPTIWHNYTLLLTDGSYIDFTADL